MKIQSEHLTSGKPHNNWPAVFSLAIGAFSSVTTEFIPVGVLPEVAHNFSVTSGQAGLMMTLPGILGAIAAPGVLIASGKTDRKKLLVTLSLLLLVSALTSALSSSWLIMLVSRALAGVSLGAFWAMGLAVAGNLVSTDKAGTAIAAVFGGVTVAMIIGVPLGSLVAEYFSWRGAFGAAALMAAISLILQTVFLPVIKASEPMRIRSLLSFTGHQRGRKSLLLIALIYGTHFGTYTYLAPLLKQADIHSQMISWILLGFGITGFAANFIAPRYANKNLPVTLTVGLVMLAGSLMAISWLEHPTGLISSVLVWGAAWGAVPLCLNLGNREASGNELEAGSAMFTFTAQVSIAAGSATGGIIVDSAGLEVDFMAGGIVIVLSGLIL
ncbi:TPA: MFS transporter [Klebsiella michiganensis]|nr:MFS transporter [Klebsiella michiganensis]